jgi:hypothetical protein
MTRKYYPGQFPRKNKIHAPIDYQRRVRLKEAVNASRLKVKDFLERSKVQPAYWYRALNTGMVTETIFARMEDAVYSVKREHELKLRTPGEYSYAPSDQRWPDREWRWRTDDGQDILVRSDLERVADGTIIWACEHANPLYQGADGDLLFVRHFKQSKVHYWDLKEKQNVRRHSSDPTLPFAFRSLRTWPADADALAVRWGLDFLLNRGEELLRSGDAGRKGFSQLWGIAAPDRHSDESKRVEAIYDRVANEEAKPTEQTAQSGPVAPVPQDTRWDEGPDTNPLGLDPAGRKNFRLHPQYDLPNMTDEHKAALYEWDDMTYPERDAWMEAHAKFIDKLGEFN